MLFGHLENFLSLLDNSVCSKEFGASYLLMQDELALASIDKDADLV